MISNRIQRHLLSLVTAPETKCALDLPDESLFIFLQAHAVFLVKSQTYRLQGNNGSVALNFFEQIN